MYQSKNGNADKFAIGFGELNAITFSTRIQEPCGVRNRPASGVSNIAACARETFQDRTSPSPRVRLGGGFQTGE